MNRDQPNYSNTTHYPYPQTEPRFQQFADNSLNEEYTNPTYRSIGLDEREKR